MERFYYSTSLTLKAFVGDFGVLSKNHPNTDNLNMSKLLFLKK